jgi:hypothetical protein
MCDGTVVFELFCFLFLSLFPLHATKKETFAMIGGVQNVTRNENRDPQKDSCFCGEGGGI